jgi:hypothetical protein
VVTGSGQVAHDEVTPILDLLAATTPALRADVQPLASALTGLGRDASVFAILGASQHAPVTELLGRPRMPGTSVALLLQPWTWTPGTGRDLIRQEAWQATADRLRTAGWRVVPADRDADLAELWPRLLSARVAARR